jgi:hypothetical protein
LYAIVLTLYREVVRVSVKSTSANRRYHLEMPDSGNIWEPTVCNSQNRRNNNELVRKVDVNICGGLQICRRDPVDSCTISEVMAGPS